MRTCARCKETIPEDSGIKMRRKDGSPVVICANCAAEVRAKRNKDRSPRDTPKNAPVSSVTDEKEKSGEKWYQTIGVGILSIVFGVLVYMQLSRLEAGDINSVRIWWPVAVLYNIFGFWGAVSCPGVLALFFFGLGIKQLITTINE